MPGPPPKPASERQGHRERPGLTVVAKDPADGIEIPVPPAGLLKATRDRWEAYWRSSVSAAVDLDSDRGLLERWIRACDELARVGTEFRKKRVVEGSTGQLVMNPLAKYMAQLEKTIGQAETQLGLTPAARLRLGITAGQARLTADMLNRSLTQSTPGDAEILDGEWEEA